MISIDLSGLEALQSALKLDRSELNRKFMEEEGKLFVETVTNPATHPIDTGKAIKSWNVDEITQEGNETRADWRNTAVNEQNQPYLGFVNYGTKHITPRLFNEKALNAVKEGKQERYQKMFAEKFNEALDS